jgi:hypothetical protein
MAFVQGLANCRRFASESRRQILCFQSLAIGMSIAPNHCTAPSATVSGSQMLRITRTANGEVFFRISGDLDAENVAEIEVVIAEEKEGSRITLDLTDLRSVDGDAVRSLEKWEADSIKLRNCAPYIREWIRRQRVERQSEKGT